MNLLYLIVITGLLLCSSCKWNENQTYQNILRPVKIRPVGAPDALDKVYTGIVEAEEFTKLAFRVGGPLVRMNVDAGENIRKGDIIAVIDPSDYQLQYEGNRAAYITARSQLERNKNLLAMQAISQQDYEVSQAGYVQAESAYETSRISLRDTKLRAPFDGFIEEKYVENYQKVQPGEPIIKLVNPDLLTVRFVLPETSVGLTRERLEVTVEFDIYRGYHFRARIKEFVDASPDGSGIPVKLMIDDSLFNKRKYPVYPGFSVRVNLKIEGKADDFSVVPLSAVFIDPLTEETSVWVYRSENSTVSRRKIDILQLFGRDKVMIANGLEKNDEIVVDGVDFITEGQQVSVMN